MDNLDLNPRIISAVKKARELSDFGSILSLSGPDIQRLTQLSASDVKQLQKAVAETVPGILQTTALELHQNRGPSQLHRSKLTTGCQVLDDFLRGGFLTQTLTEIAGQSAAGKTQLCMQLCLTVQLPKDMGGLEAGAAYICTEDVFPNKRLNQMAELLKKRCTCSPKVKDTQFTDNIFIEHAAEMDDLWYCISRKLPLLLAQGRVRLVVIDSIAALFRCEFDPRAAQSRAKQMRKFACQLLKLASQFDLPVICVNQVSDLIADTSGGAGSQRKVIPALGISWANLVTVRVMLMRTDQTVTIPQVARNTGTSVSMETVVRTMEVLFAPHLPRSLCRYIVDQDGVKGLQTS